jgi:signal transduction histidine kinase
MTSVLAAGDLMRHRGAVERGVLTGVAVLRWAAWAWLAGVTIANLPRVHHPVVAVAAVIATGVVTVVANAALRGPGWRRALSPGVLSIEVVVAFAVIAADGWVRQGRVTGQNLAGLWPLAAILVVAVAGGAAWGAAVGVLFSLGRAFAAVQAGVPAGQAGRTAVAVASTAVSWVLVGAVCGTIVWLLRQSQHQLAEAEARERIARDLHDGVLQTLALIERRSPSPEIARLARDQERDLRAYLFDDERTSGGLASELRDAGARVERSWPDVTVTVTLSDDVPRLGDEQLAAAVGAAAEALTNAVKHGHAQHVVVFADLDEATGGLFLSVKDDGAGFDPATVVEGVGLARSIRGRVEQAGGSVGFASAPGDGAEVRICLPRSPSREGARR